MSEARMLELLERLDSRLERLERRVDELAFVADQAPRAIGAVTDTVDGLVVQAAEKGIDVDERMRASVQALELLSRPETVATLEQALQLAEMAPGMVAGAVDTADGVMAKLASQGVDVDQRLGMLLQAADHLTRPETLRLLTTLTARADELQLLVDTLLESGVFEPDAVEMVGRAGGAMVSSRGTVEPIGAFGLLRSVSDPDVGRALAFGVAFAKRFGEKLPTS